MFKSRAVAKVNPSNFCNTVLILGIGNDFLTSPLLGGVFASALHTSELEMMEYISLYCKMFPHCKMIPSALSKGGGAMPGYKEK